MGNTMEGGKREAGSGTSKVAACDLQSLSNYWYSDAFAKPTSRSHLLMLLTNCNALHKFARIALSNIKRGNGGGCTNDFCQRLSESCNEITNVSEINLFMLRYTLLLTVASTRCL